MLYLERYFLQNIWISIYIVYIYTNSPQRHHKHTRKYVLPIRGNNADQVDIWYNTYKPCITQKYTLLKLKGAHATEAGAHTLIQGHMFQSLESDHLKGNIAKLSKSCYAQPHAYINQS